MLDYCGRIVAKAAKMMRGERQMGVIVIVSHDTLGLKLAQAGHSEMSLLAVMKDAADMLDKDRLALKKAVTPPSRRGDFYEVQRT